VYQMKLAVIIPCHNEESTIGDVVDGFRKYLPDAEVYVADNASTDETAIKAQQAGAKVLLEPRKGKGFAVTRLFADVDADYYLMVDGDNTYSPEAALEAIGVARKSAVDLVLINRVGDSGKLESHRRGHDFGNRVLTWTFQKLFKLQLQDTLTGYRLMSRRFVKSFPADPSGFEVETELNVHANLISASVAQVSGNYKSRPDGSVSKLGTYSDGYRILKRVLGLFRDTKPVVAFSLLASPWLVLGFLLTARALIPYLETGVVEFFPSLIAGVGAIVFATQLFVSGLVLARIASLRQEARRLVYLSTH
jgi:glycosyltransferase involved in cell wall biosynthesis